MTKEEFYDQEIAPKLLDLSKQCHEKGLSFFAVVEFDPNGRGVTRQYNDGYSLEMFMYELLRLCGRNIDAFIMQLMKYAKKEGIDYRSSIVLNLLESAPPEEIGKAVQRGLK